MSRCTVESHAALRATVGAFEDGTRHLASTHGLIYGNCHACGSTLAMAACLYCDCAIDAGHEVIVTDERYAHLKCIIDRAVRRGRVKFVVIAKNYKARELRLSLERVQ